MLAHVDGGLLSCGNLLPIGIQSPTSSKYKISSNPTTNHLPSIAYFKYISMTTSRPHNILITGASGYLGGTLLSRWQTAQLPSHGTLYALVRTEQQSQAVQQYGATPLYISLDDDQNIIQTIVEHEISIIYFLIDAASARTQTPMIQALGQVRERTGKTVHFLHTSGAKLFSSHAGHPTDRAFSDADPGLYELQRTAKPSHPWLGPVSAISFLYLYNCLYTYWV